MENATSINRNLSGLLLCFAPQLSLCPSAHWALSLPGSVLLLVFTETQALPGGSWGKNVECDGGILNVVPFFNSFTSPLNVIIKDHLLYDLPSHVHNSGPLLMGHASLPETLPTLSFFLTPFCLFLISYPMPKARKWPWVEIVLRA